MILRSLKIFESAKMEEEVTNRRYTFSSKSLGQLDSQFPADKLKVVGYSHYRSKVNSLSVRSYSSDDRRKME